MKFPRIAAREDLGILAVTRFVLQVIALLSGFLSLVTVAYLLSESAEAVSVISLAPIPVFLITCFALNPKSSLSKSGMVPAMLIGLFYFFSFITVLHWGFDAPQGLLTLALSGILLALLYNGITILLVFLVASILYVAIALVQVYSLIQISSYWRSLPSNGTDVAVYSVTLAIIFYITWLFHQRLHLALLESRRSEQRYRELSENLDYLVRKKTSELREEHTQRMSDVHQFVMYGKEVTSLLHDIVNPLTVLGLQVEKLQKTSEVGDDVRDLQRTVRRLEGFVNTARSRMRNERIQEEVSIKQELVGAVKSLQHRANKQEVRLVVSGPDVRIQADPITFYKIFINLISNALESFEELDRNHKIVRTNIRIDGDSCEISIQDNGNGILQNNLKKIFKPLFTTKSSKHNSGIGLTMVRQMLKEELRGKIDVSSTYGKGTQVILTFPLVYSREN